MWTTLALMTLSLAPAQGGSPDFKNVRFTHGLLGQARKSDKYLAGDTVVLAFDVANMTVKNNGRVLYSMGMEVTKKGDKKPVLSRDAEDREVINTLGGGTFPSFAAWVIPRDMGAPGEYTLKVTVTDRETKKSQTLTRKFTVEKPRLGFVQVFLSSLRGDPIPPVAVPGQRVLLHHTLVGFGFDKKEKQTDITLTIRVLDSNDKPTLAEPYKGPVKTDAKSAPGVMLLTPYLMELNRPGKYKVELKAVDNVTGKSTTETLDLTVLSVK